MREKKKQEIENFCKENGINLINLRNMKKQGKTRIIVTFLCKDCGTRYDMMWDNVKTQEFMGCCTKCAHKRSQDYRRLQAQALVDKFEQYGYKVITPLDKIKPRGKGKTLNKAIVMVENRAGQQFDICYNNFHNRLEEYIKLNEAGLTPRSMDDRKYEMLVKDYLDELGVEYKREFTFGDLRGENGGMLRFDFCVNYKEPDNLRLIEVDESRDHYQKDSFIFRHDRAKDYYCDKHNIPLLRLKVDNFKEGNFKDLIKKLLNR